MTDTKVTGNKRTSKDKRSGKKPTSRKLQTIKGNKELTANQWQNTPQQLLFMESWLTPTSPTFGNAYQSALKAGYNDKYARIIVSDSTNNKWISEFMNKTEFTEDHILQGIQEIYSNPEVYNNARSPADTRLKALEVMGKSKGMFKDNNRTTVNIVQPILAGQSYKPTDTSSPPVEIIDIEE